MRFAPVKLVTDFFRNVKALSAVDSSGSTGGWFSIIREGFAGAWQSNIVLDSQRNILAFSAVYACVTMIATDIAKLDVELMQENDDGTSTRVRDSKNSPWLTVLKKPNHYQTWYKFIEQWIVSKLLHGNAYILKQRDSRNIVNALHVLDPSRVTTLITDDGSIYYKLSRDDLAEVKEEEAAAPASEIIHDMMVSLWHPLVGVSPIFACGVSATMGNKIQANSLKFFANMSRPSGGLTSPGTINNETAERLKKEFEDKFGNGNIGRLFIAGDGLKYEAMTMPANDAQLIEQLKWTVEDVARCFHMPLYKLGGPLPVRASVESDQQTYYSDCLQGLIESSEALLEEGLEIKSGYCVEFDLDGLLRMDTAAQYEAEGMAVKNAIKAPNEARLKLNLPPKPGGDSLYLQQQNFSTEALAKRDALENPFASAAPAKPSADESQTTKLLLEQLIRLLDKRFDAPALLPAPAREEAEEDHLGELAELFVSGM